jgi:hypothetical protein
MQLATLADVRTLVEKHLPVEYRRKFIWRHLAGLLKRVAEGQQDSRRSFDRAAHRAAVGRRALPVGENKVATAIDNFVSLHEHEERLRGQSLDAIKADAALADHWTLVAEAMTAIHTFSKDHICGSENELTLQYLGARLFNAAGASVKLALSGYYQKAFDQVRDLLETSFLVDYLTAYPVKFDEWRRADKKARLELFGTGVIRNALDKRDGDMSGGRKAIYGHLSEMASHPTFQGIALTASGPSSMVQVGPFFDQKMLTVWLQELAMRPSPAALGLLRKPEGRDLNLLTIREHYLAVSNEWASKYLGAKL